METSGPVTQNSKPISQKCVAEDNKPRKMKILALHGYRQNAETFRAKTGSFRKVVHKLAQFTYVTAPHKVVNYQEDNSTLESEYGIALSTNDEQYGWFFNRDDRTYRGIRRGGPAIGFEESIKLIETVFEKEGPFDGVLGFSQGACFVGLLCDLQQRGLTSVKFNFVILSSGFKSGCLPHLKYYDDRITIPSLHIYGENDNIIATEMSEALSNCFENPIVIKHNGGHYLPAGPPQKLEYQRFFKKRLSEKIDFV